MKVIIVSRHFPKKHPKAGQETLFVDKVLLSLGWEFDNSVDPKHHTLRAGDRWFAGEMASLRYWTAAPYRSKQKEFAQVEIKRVWNIRVDKIGNIEIEDRLTHIHAKEFTEIAKNDGLDRQDLIDWLKCHPKRKKGKYLFDGQIVCWSSSIKY